MNLSIHHLTYRFHNLCIFFYFGHFLLARELAVILLSAYVLSLTTET